MPTSTDEAIARVFGTVEGNGTTTVKDDPIARAFGDPEKMVEYIDPVTGKIERISKSQLNAETSAVVHEMFARGRKRQEATQNDQSLGVVGGNVNAISQKFSQGAANIMRGTGLNALTGLVSGDGQGVSDSMEEQAAKIPQRPGIATAPGRLIGNAAPVILGGEAAPFAMAAQGGGSALKEGEEEKWGAGTTAAFYIERAALGFLFGKMIPGGKTGVNLPTFAKSLAAMEGIGLGQWELEVEMKRVLGLKTDDELTTFLNHVKDGDAHLANLAFAAVHTITSQKAAEKDKSLVNETKSKAPVVDKHQELMDAVERSFPSDKTSSADQRETQESQSRERAFRQQEEIESQLSHLRESTIPEGFVESLLPKEEAPTSIKSDVTTAAGQRQFIADETAHQDQAAKEAGELGKARGSELANNEQPGEILPKEETLTKDQLENILRDSGFRENEILDGVSPEQVQKAKEGYVFHNGERVPATEQVLREKELGGWGRTAREKTLKHNLNVIKDALAGGQDLNKLLPAATIDRMFNTNDSSSHTLNEMQDRYLSSLKDIRQGREADNRQLVRAKQANQPKESLPSEKQDEPTPSGRPSAEALKDLQSLHEEHQRILENDNLSPQERETKLDEIQKEQISAVRDLTGIKDPTPREVVDALRNAEIEQLKSQSTAVPTTASVEQAPIKLPSKTQNELETLQAQHRAIAEMSRTSESDSPEVTKWLSDAADRIDSLKRQVSLEAPTKQQRLDSHQGGFVQIPKILESLVERGLATGKWTLDHTIAAAHWIASKGSNIAEATKQLVSRFGEAIKPHLDKIVSLAKEHIEAAQRNSLGAVGDVGKVRMARIAETAKDVATAIRIEHGDKPEPESAIRKGFAKLTGDDLANTPHKGVIGETIERLKDIKTFVSDSMAGHPEMKKVFVEDAIGSTSEQKSDFNRMTEEWKKIASEQGLKPKQIARMETETQRVTAGGQSLRLTRMQIAMVTAAVQRASNLKAMVDGGLVIEGREGSGQVVKDPAMINAIIAAAGPVEKALAEGSVKRVYPLVTEKLIKVKGEESGRPLRLEEGYSPRSTSDEGVQKGLNEKMKSEGVKGDQEYIEGMNKAHQQLADDLSIVQPAGKTGQPFVIRSLNKVVQEFIQKASIYGNKTQAIREMLLYRGNPELREALRFSAGENALQYLDRYISDASGLFNREGDAAIKRVVGKLRSNYASTILFAKVSSAVKHYVGNSMNVATQFSGQDLVDYVKGVAKASAGIGNAEYKSRISEDMGTLHERIVGRGSDLLTAPLEGERAIVRATSVGRRLEKVRDFGGKPFKLADFPAIRGAMEANEGAITREGKLSPGSPEFEKEVIRRTTINIESAANPITKEGQADLYRSLNKTPLSLATVFKSPAMKTLNLVMQEVGNFRRAESSAEKSQALRNLAIIATGRLLTSAIGVGTSAAVVSLAVKASRGGVQQKDKDRVLRTALLEAVREVGGSVPIVSDLLDEIVSRSAGLKGTTSQGPIGQISDVAGGVGDLIHELTVGSKSESRYTKASEEEHSKKLMSAFDKLLPALTNTLGIPFSSVYLDTKKVVKPLSEQTTAQEWAEKIRQKDPDVRTQLTKMVNEGKLSREGLKKIYERAGMGDQRFDLREADVEEALTMWKGSTKEERKGIASEVFAKVRSSSKIPAEEKRSLFTRLRAEMN